MNTIEVTVRTSPLPPITGAALRAAQAADREAELKIATLRTTSAHLSQVLNSPTVDATTLAEGFAALAAWEAAHKDLAGIVRRWAVEVGPGPGSWDLPGVYGHGFESPGSALGRAASAYHNTLVDSGVPMEGRGLCTAEFWRDAAARGC